ncbi:hypothetical protein GGR57DRAFT_153197 [Xylariaceae sp. FL1272]|nr:hypothetical protein GGR57DRAFT_153197 [Xylariaceae sp. FL1272]
MDSSETSRHDEYSGPSSPSRRGQRQPTRSRMQQVEQADIPRGFSDQPLTEHELILPQSEEANIQDGSVSSNSRLSYISAASRLDSGSPGRESSDRSQAGSAISESLVHDHVRQSASAPLSFIQEPAEETPNYVLSSRTPPSASPSTPAYEPDHDGESNALFNATSEDERETSESENRARIRNWRNRSVYSNFVPPDTDSAEPPSSRQDYHTRVEDTEDEEYRHRHARNRGKSRPTPSDWESDEMDGRYSGSAASHTEPKTSPSLGTTGGNRVPYPSESFTSESGSSGDELDYRESDEYSSRSEGNRPQRFSARDWPRNTPPPPFPNPFAPRYPDYYQQPPPPPQYIPPVHYPATSPYVPTHYPAQYGQDNYSHFYHPDPPYNNATSGYNYPPPPPTAPSYRADSRPGLDRPPVENTKAGATAQAEAVSTYKPPVSSDASAHALSMDISLKSSSSRSRHDQETHGELRGDAPSTNGEGVYHWKTDHSLLRRSGRGHLTRIQSLELYTDRAGRDRVTMFKPLHSISSQTRGGPKLFRWLHLEQQTLCLDDLQKLTFDCPFLDKDLKSLADRLLRQQCTKFEKRYSNGVHSGHYIEPGTVLRCDSRHDQVLNQKAESVIFCSVPYLHLDKQERQGHDIRDSEDKIHPTRTLMESLYDYELMENRDDRQAVLRCSSPEQENIVYVPQIWYLLCGSGKQHLNQIWTWCSIIS